VSASDSTVAGCTVRVAVPLLPSNAAVMMLVPARRPVARPVAVTVPTWVVAELQAALALMSRAEPSLYEAVAVNCCLAPMATEAVAGVTAMLASVAAGTPRIGSRPWSPLPQPASSAAASKPAEQISSFVYRFN